MKKILIISKKYRETDKEKPFLHRYNRVFSDNVSIIDLPLEVGEVLINNNRITFKAVSWCMFPIIWAGDTLEVEPIKLEDVKIGDIVLYKSEGFAFAHRLIKTYTEKDKSYIITTGEREFRNNRLNNFADVASADCGGVLADNILGRVTEIKRGRLSFKPNEADESQLSLMQGSLRLSLWIFKRRAKKYIAKTFIKLQGFKLYRYFLRGLVRNKISFLVGTPLIKKIGEVNNFRFYQTFEDSLKDFSGTNGLYNISARIKNKPVGDISLFLERMDNRKVCALSNFIVRMPFRGAGVGCRLLEKALYLCNKLNIDEIKAVLSEEDKIACGLFKKLGFRVLI